MKADVVVIGGAVMGASVAFWLTRLQPGLDVLVVERDPTFARASTALAAAGIRQQFSNPVNVEISRFGIQFIKNFQSHLGHDVGIPDLSLRENGYLFLTRTAEGLQTLTDLAALQRDHGDRKERRHARLKSGCSMVCSTGSTMAMVLPARRRRAGCWALTARV